MRKLLSVILSIGLCLFIVSLCACSSRSGATDIEDEVLPAEAIQEIYNIAEEAEADKYITIRDVEDKGNYLYVGINIIYNPELILNLEDAFNQAEMWTDAVARTTAKLINSYGIDKDISVWAQLPLGEGEVALLGNTWYRATSNTFGFKRYKS